MLEINGMISSRLMVKKITLLRKYSFSLPL